MIRTPLLLLLLVLTSLVARSETVFFDEHDCLLSFPDTLWTIERSGAEYGVLLEAHTENRVRQVRLEVNDAPEGAVAINDSGLVETLLAGIPERGTRSGKGFYWLNNDMCYELCFDWMDGTVREGVRYILVVKHGRLYRLIFRARYASPCEERGFTTIANSWIVADEPGMLAGEEGFTGNPFEPGSEEFAQAIEAQTRTYRITAMTMGLSMLILVIGIPGWLTYFWLTRRKRLLREAELDAELPTAPDLELARILLNPKQHSIDAVDIAENELTRRGTREHMLEMARNEPRRIRDESDDEPGLRLSAAAIDRRLLQATVAGGIVHLAVLGVAIQSALSKSAPHESSFILASILVWGVVGLILAYGVRRGSWVGAIGLIPSVLFLPLWASLYLEIFSLLPLLLLSVPVFRAIRAVDDGARRRHHEIDLASVGWEQESALPENQTAESQTPSRW